MVWFTRAKMAFPLAEFGPLARSSKDVVASETGHVHARPSDYMGSFYIGFTLFIQIFNAADYQ